MEVLRVIKYLATKYYYIIGENMKLSELLKDVDVVDIYNQNKDLNIKSLCSMSGECKSGSLFFCT